MQGDQGRNYPTEMAGMSRQTSGVPSPMLRRESHRFRVALCGIVRATMTLSPGISIAGYEVTGRLGKGGMGEVWRARDTRLGRDVALKTLPPEFSADIDRVARFEREAKVLASLNHSHIAAIYGVHASADMSFLVLELVEGDTVAGLLANGPLPVRDALRLAVQVAEAIEAAHEKGIVHRDLKPANIKVTPDGTVKVLDFGLAKGMQPDPADAKVLESPTFSMAATAKGIILGTAAYMSPEQARGQAVDHRADIWSFGCVLFEMLTGHRAFRGELVSDILASVLAREPEFADLPPTLDPRLKESLRRCLEKDPKRRWQAIGDLRVELEHILANPSGGVASPGPRRSSVITVLPYVAATAIIAAAAAWMLKPAPVSAPAPIVRFDFELPQNQTFRGTGRAVVAVSPDGRHFAYNTTGGVYLRSMENLASRLIPGTELLVTNVFFSPNGEWLGYWANSSNLLQKISISGGAPVTITAANNPFGASWERDNTILFGAGDGIRRVSADGGTPETIIKIKPGEAAASPSLLPDGKTILYSLARADGPARWDQAEIIAQQPGGAAKVLIKGGSDARYAPSGHLVYAIGNVLYAVPFDAGALEVRGGPVPLVTGVQRALGPANNTPSANFGLSDRGTLVYLNAVANAPPPESTLAIVDRNGTMRTLEVPKAIYRSPRVSPDGRRIAVETISDAGQNVIWVYDLSGTAAIRRLTQEGNNSRPVWTPDGRRIAYGSDRDGKPGIFWQLADGSGLPERLTTAEQGFQQYPESFSPDAKVMSFARVRVPLGASAWALYTMRLDQPERKPELFFDLPNSNEFGSNFSPDGKWIAYASNASPTANGEPTSFAIYVQPYPPTGVKYEISQTGGAWPIWSSMGRELLYRMNANEATTPKINVVSIATSPVPTFTAERPLPIQGFLPVTNFREYDIFPNGRDLVMVFPAARPTTTAPPSAHIYTVLNWFEELKTRVSPQPR